MAYDQKTETAEMCLLCLQAHIAFRKSNLEIPMILDSLNLNLNI